MGSPAERVTEALTALLEARPANADRPHWVSLPSEAARRGMGTNAFRQWCHRRGVTIREGSHREAWVAPAEVDRAIEGLPAAKRPASRTPTRDEVDEALDERHGAR